MLSPRGLSVGFAALGSAFAFTSSYAADIFKARLSSGQKGTIAEFQPMSRFCGTSQSRSRLLMVGAAITVATCAESRTKPRSAKIPP